MEQQDFFDITDGYEELLEFGFCVKGRETGGLAGFIGRKGSAGERGAEENVQF